MPRDGLEEKPKTKRQIQKLSDAGCGAKQIADQLSIDVSTVYRHKAPKPRDANAQ